MKVALAQIDMRLGDIDGICERIETQVQLAAKQGARLFCAPAPLIDASSPYQLAMSTDFEHDLCHSLLTLAEAIKDTHVVCLVPAALIDDDGPYFELFMLKAGRVIPARSIVIRQSKRAHSDRIAPPVFEVDGVRVAATFDAEHDIPDLMYGVDLVVSFQVFGFDASNPLTTGVAAVRSGKLSKLASSKGVWIAHMAPIGAYDDVVYTGGSFVMDDAGHVISAAPVFEEALLVQEVDRGRVFDALADHQLPLYNREEWLWQASIIALRSQMRVQSASRAVIALDGGLASAAAAALAVDAIGPRNVFGLAIAADRVETPRSEAEEQERIADIRATADALHIRLIEHEPVSYRDVIDADGAPVRPADSDADMLAISGLCLLSCARALNAFAVSPLTKTHYALDSDVYRGVFTGDYAPFGDIYLTELEFVARVRNRMSPVLPARLVSLTAVKRAMDAATSSGARSIVSDTELAGRLVHKLSSMEPNQVDAVLEAHVDRNASFDDCPLSKLRPDDQALLLLIVRKGERSRRSLPLYPVLGARSFADRGWPYMLGWSDTGLHGAEPVTVDSLVAAEIKRFNASDDETLAARMNIMNVLGELLGIPQDQLEQLKTDEGQEKMRRDIEKFGEQIQRAIEGDDGEEGPSTPPNGGNGPVPPFGSGQFMPPFFSNN